MSDISHRIVETNGIKLHLAEAGSGPLVVMVHGWPESWYSWRHQIKALSGAGYHAVAPDVRGYGGSDKPHEVEAYRMSTIVGDIAGLVEALGEEGAVVVGHDWGAPIAYHCALLRPDRFRAVCGMSVPYTGRSGAPPLETFAKLFVDSFFYIDYFQRVGVAEKELEADPTRSLRLILYSASGDAPPAPGFAGKPKGAGLLDGMTYPDTLPGWLTEADVEFYGNEFASSGFRGPINRYRNMDHDWHELSHLQDARIKQPCAFIGGQKDGVIALNPTGVETMKGLCDDWRGATLIPGAGHWNQQERPGETNAALLAFLKGL